MNTSRTIVAVRSLVGKILSVIGWFLAVMFVFFMIGIATGDMFAEDFILMVIFLLVPAVWCIAMGIRIKRRTRRFKQYVSVLSAQGDTSIHVLAGAVNQHPGFVKQDIQFMIDKRFFPNARIDNATDTVVIGRKPEATYMQPFHQANPGMGATPPGVPVIESFTCPGCAAVGRKQRGASGECDYCGTIVS